MKSKAIKEKFIELRAQGHSYASIAADLKVSKPTLIEWSQEFEFRITNLKTIEMETLQEKYLIQKQNRIELFGQQIQTIKAELSTRDMKEVSTEKLFDLLAKYTKALRDEETPFRFMGQGYFGQELLPRPREWQA